MTTATGVSAIAVLNVAAQRGSGKGAVPTAGISGVLKAGWTIATGSAPTDTAAGQLA